MDISIPAAGRFPQNSTQTFADNKRNILLTSDDNERIADSTIFSTLI
jgi:hypothetical protein